jgi:hypothetical protein
LACHGEKTSNLHRSIGLAEPQSRVRPAERVRFAAGQGLFGKNDVTFCQTGLC